MEALEGRDREAVAKNHSDTGPPPAPMPTCVPAPLAWFGVSVVSHRWLGCPVARRSAKSKDPAACVGESHRHGGMVGVSP